MAQLVNLRTITRVQYWASQVASLRLRQAWVDTASQVGRPTATSGNAQATVSWADVSDPSLAEPVTGYLVTAEPGGSTASAAANATSAVVSGLSNGTSYTFTVQAVNRLGNSAPSLPSNPVTPAAPATAPSAPGSVQAIALSTTSALVVWGAPSDGGSALTGYTVSGIGGSHGVAAGTTSLTVTGLTPGASYTASVTATNAVGTSSAGTGSVTLAATPTAPTISVVSPPLNTGVSRRTPLVLDVTDAQGLERAVLLVSQGDAQSAELAYDGVRFTAPYAQGSTVATISGGLRFSLLRAGGWLGSPTVEIVAYDVAGKES